MGRCGISAAAAIATPRLKRVDSRNIAKIGGKFAVANCGFHAFRHAVTLRARASARPLLWIKFT
ncbi:MAG: hypothetical protein C0485_16180 [Pirellula sp.]|nr:hypothetical protein [Pirellula sp.]